MENQIFNKNVCANGERCNIRGNKYAQTLRGVTMTCQNGEELGLLFGKSGRPPVDFAHF